MKVLILAGGGTAGHIMPLVAVAKKLKDNFDKIYYIGSGKDLENKLIAPLNVEILNIDPPKLYRKITYKNLLIPFKMAKAVNKARQILKDKNASVVFSKGGYCALPVCLAANSLNIPYVCHESDLTMGLANKLTYKKAKYLCTTFKETAKQYNGVFVGPVIKDDLFEISKERAKAYLGIESKKPVLLVTGGSQGSKTINNAVFENLDKLLENFYVIHLCGKGNKPLYKAINGYLPLEFYNMAYLINACDICISRGGSNTIFELMMLKKPTLIVPLKKNSRGDQVKNANYFLNKRAAFIRDEENLSDTIYKDAINLYEKREFLIENIKKLNIENGTYKIKDCILNCLDVNVPLINSFDIKV